MRAHAAIFVILAWGTAWAADAHAGFTVIDLGALSTSGSSAAGMNSGGTGVGTSTASDGTSLAVRYGGGSPAPVGLLPNARSSVGNAINDKGLVAGMMEIQISTGQFVFHAFKTGGDGKPEDIGTLPGGRSSVAYSINGSGQVAGVTQFGSIQRGFVGSGAGAISSIGTLAEGLNSSAVGLNDNGWIVGTADDASGVNHAVIGFAGQLTRLGNLPGAGASFGTAINNANEAVGYAQVGSGFHAFLARSPGDVIDLGTLPFGSSSIAFGINDASQVVGTVAFGGSGSSAFLWTPEQQRMYDLNLLIDPSDAKDWVLLSATAINGTSQIVGNGLYKGQARAFLLDPIPGQWITDAPRPPVVPEPASALLLGLGVGSLLFADRLRRRRKFGRAGRSAG